MSSPVTLQQSLLSPALRLLGSALKGGSAPEASELKLDILEASSSVIGGFNLETYREIMQRGTLPKDAIKIGRSLVDAISTGPIEPAIVLSILATVDLAEHQRKENGVYNTDFRLARHLAKRMPLALKTNFPKIIDPACGPGILLIAYALRHVGKNGACPPPVLTNCLFGVDLSPEAIRGALLSLASLTAETKVIREMALHFRVSDSLMAPTSLWRGLAPDGFDGIIANPPWERLRVLAHEHLKANGQKRHYGAEYSDAHHESLGEKRAILNAYKTELNGRHRLQGKGEQDLYKLFIELACSIVKPRGRIAMLVPAGLIRSQGARDLRASLTRKTGTVDIEIADNKARFFGIDTRFKFLVLDAEFTPEQGGSRILLRHATGTITGLDSSNPVEIRTSILEKLRPDLTLPEVKTQAEWDLFQRLAETHPVFGDSNSPWSHRYHRELDMSLDRTLFEKAAQAGHLPLIEGRMVHQFQFGAKAYKAGTGRKALWVNSSAGSLDVTRPQFFVAPDSLAVGLRQRTASPRAGFCDVTGQTNERTMLAALIPPGSVCGNKVPTLEFFQQDRYPELPFLWIGLANSLIFDWLLRRVCTTTVNFFILDSIPIPSLERRSPVGSRIAKIAEQLMVGAEIPFSAHTAALRAELDALAFAAYGLNQSECELVLSDFPQLDKEQPPIAGEPRSTITRDTVLLAVSKRIKNRKLGALFQARVSKAHKAGAMPFVPNQFSVQP
jgi:hypothetical protein